MAMMVLGEMWKQTKETILPLIETDTMGYDPFFSMIETTSEHVDITGKIKMPVKFGSTGGFGFNSETDNLPSGSGADVDFYETQLGRLRGSINMTDDQKEAIESGKSYAYTNFVALFEDFTKTAKKIMAAAYWIGSDSVLASCEANAVASNVITVDTTQYLGLGFWIDIYDATNNIVKATKRKIVSKTKTSITIDGTALVIGANDKITLQDSYNKGIVGFRNLFSGDTTTGTLYGLDRATHDFLRPKIVDFASGGLPGIFDEIRLGVNVGDLQQERDVTPNMWLTTIGVLMHYVKILKQAAQSPEIMNLEGGYKSIKYNGVPMVSSPYAWKNTLKGLNSDDFKVLQTKPWHVMPITANGDETFTRRQNTPYWDMTAQKKYQMICTLPANQIICTNIKEEAA